MSLTEAQIAELTDNERADLIRRLQGPIDLTHLPRPRRLRVARRARLGLMTSGTLVLIPWIMYLAASLPTSYHATNWRITWVGFDLLLLTLMGSTVILGLLRRQLVVLTAFATGVLLICDAWFDVMTAGPGDRMWALLSAFCVELPIALLLTVGTVRLLQALGATLTTFRPVLGVLDLRLPDEN